MMKKLSILSLSLILLLLVACGAKTVSIDPSALASDLMENLTFQDSLYQLDAATAQSLFALDESTACVAYAGTGATSEELAVFTTADKTAATALITALQKRLDERIEGYKNYLPEEVDKLNHAVLQQEGNYVIFCVAKDVSNAKDVIASYLN
ncbi:MAG: DUF4358 domain-containing protein [Evtepia sp.]